MKKITFALFALIAGTTFAQNSASASGTATVNAEIVSPISISAEGSNLDFGRIIGNAAGGIVTISTASERTTDNDDLLAPTTTVQAAAFEITAAENYKFSIDIPSINLVGEGDPMNVEFTNNLGTENVVGTGAVQNLLVGGALTVNTNQQEGAYTGTVIVTVSYE